MIKLDVLQGSDEWHAVRLGIPTASAFNRIITPKTMALSSGADAYMCELIAERMLGVPVDDYASQWTDRGHRMEEEARARYELEHDIEVEPVGFILRDDRRVGCSPDGLVGADGGLEIKCPTAAHHIENLLDMPSRFNCQVQGGMWIAEREWWDLLSYCPGLPPARVRIRRDERFIKALANAVEHFLVKLETALEHLQEVAA